MARSQADKARNTERILAAAAAQVRDGGLESVSVGALMRSVDLTHGGFYRHFASRSDLLAQALARALNDGEAASNAARDPAKNPGYAPLVRSYMSRAHRDSRRRGCAIAALASDVARADAPVREVMEAFVERFIGKVARAMETEDDAQAILATSAMIGGLLLARVATDPKRSDEILRVVRDGVIELGRNEPPAPRAAGPSRAARAP